MLRLLEGDPADAVPLCDTALLWLGTQPEGRARPDWQLVAATQVIAYARAGRENDARQLLAELLPTHPLTAAATAELAAAVDGSPSEA